MKVQARISELIQEAVERGLIVSCIPTENNSYLLQKPHETAVEYPPMMTGVILLHLLKKI